ncbi:voltage-gated hydrogen channel 1-like [Xenia sp. Carnegie-2017]|uniref:voltage-gated hydrogen channel 1-like n=1 Tax=Xenia sp. Carnegie-2017 TaxID=2897299 RepID=UPI001F034B47|nr:voltage-gated hydrogen channel 1-like [Xenia sp. Carnegie-2017]
MILVCSKTTKITAMETENNADKELPNQCSYQMTSIVNDDVQHGRKECSSDSRQGICELLKNRPKFRALLHGHRFQMVIIAFVVLDFLIVLVQLLMDIQILRGVHHHHKAIEILHYTSIGILGLFLFEIVVKLYAFDCQFFHHKLEVFDAIVVCVSFALDVAYSGNTDAWDAAGLLILLRLWRIVRIINGVALSVKIEMDHKVHHLKKEIDHLQTQVDNYKVKCEEQEKEITELQIELQKHEKVSANLDEPKPDNI